MKFVFLMSLLGASTAFAKIEIRGYNLIRDSIPVTVHSVAMLADVERVSRVTVNLTPKERSRFGETIQVVYSDAHVSVGLAAAGHVGKCATLIPGYRFDTAELILESNCR